jgi:hypothetical protein
MGKPSVESQMIEACGKYWLAKQPKQAAALKGIRIPEAGTAELLLLGPTKGTMVVVARPWAHAAAYAHVVGQAIGAIAHLINCAPEGAKAFLDDSKPSEDPISAKKIGARIAEDAAAGELGIVFAIGFAEGDGDEPVRKRLMPVLALLERWSSASGLKLGVHVWHVHLGEDDAKVEPIPLNKKK